MTWKAPDYARPVQHTLRVGDPRDQPSIEKLPRKVKILGIKSEVVPHTRQKGQESERFQESAS